MVHLKRSRRVHKHVRSLPADSMLHYGFGAGSISSSSAMCRSTASATRASSAARRRFAFPVGGDEHAADQRQAVDLHADPFGLIAARASAAVMPRSCSVSSIKVRSSSSLAAAKTSFSDGLTVSAVAASLGHHAARARPPADAARRDQAGSCAARSRRNLAAALAGASVLMTNPVKN